MNKAQIILEIQRTASENGGIPLGQRAFIRETRLPSSFWHGKWRNWGDALKDAGFAPNTPSVAYEQSFLILSLIRLTQKNKSFPTSADIRLERANDRSFPGYESIHRLGTVTERIELVRRYATEHPEYRDVLDLLPGQTPDQEESSTDLGVSTDEGYVYMALLKIGREKRYKIGKAVLVGRRTDQVSIQLPEDLELVHTIRTDDAYGIEAYWKKRFEKKNTKGEWFILSREDIQAFKKRRFM
jgi:hypothetical protein